MVEKNKTVTGIDYEVDVARTWLREFTSHNGVEVSTLAEEQMLRMGVCLLDVNYVMKNGDMINVDTDAEGCAFVIVGETCDDLVLEVAGRFASGQMFLTVESVATFR